MKRPRYVPRAPSRDAPTCDCGMPMRRAFDALSGDPLWACRNCTHTRPRETPS